MARNICRVKIEVQLPATPVKVQYSVCNTGVFTNKYQSIGTLLLEVVFPCPVLISKKKASKEKKKLVVNSAFCYIQP